jgi:HSP20 family protein
MAQGKKSKIKPSRSRDEVRARETVPRRVDERGKQEQRSMRLNSLFDEFRRDIEGVMNPWSSSLEWRLPREFSMIRPVGIEEEGTISRTPLVDMVDKGDRYFLRLELPGIEKDKIHLTATDDSLEISAEQSEEKEQTNEDKSHNFIYNERSYRSFFRSIPIPEEILSSKITAKIQNGILRVEIPKKTATRPLGEVKRIEVE